jgi:hypothetical protein
MAAFALLVSMAAASSVTILEPFNASVTQGGSILLGKVGPGQTFYVTISANTMNASGVTFSRGWNKLVATGMPQGWIVQNSSLNGADLSVKIDPSPNAHNGTYAFNLTAINIGNYSHLGTVRFQALINVTPDVFNLQITPTNISTGPGQPASIYVTINNTGVSDNPFIITMVGLPAWNATQPVIALHHTTETFTYPVYEDEPGIYRAQINVSSGSSPLVYKRGNVTLAIQASLFNDYRAVGRGAIAFPIIYQPVYAVMYLLSKLLVLAGIN